jgi:hypothetical protein
MQHRRILSLPLLALLSLGAWRPLLAAEWDVRLALGAVANLETSLQIRQAGFEEIRIDDADYETRPFESPQYYSLRAGRWEERRGWEIELIHQKLFLRNPPPEIQGFAISHGYNLVTVNRGWQLGPVVLRLGAGGVIAHPESTVRGRSQPQDGGLFEAGYHLTGPALQGAVERRFELGRRWVVGLEGKATAARAQVPVAGGEAEVPNLALHALLGLGYRF